MGFVGNYAPRGLSPQTGGMPVIPYKQAGNLPACLVTLFLFHLHSYPLLFPILVTIDKGHDDDAVQNRFAILVDICYSSILKQLLDDVLKKNGYSSADNKPRTNGGFFFLHPFFLYKAPREDQFFACRSRSLRHIPESYLI